MLSDRAKALRVVACSSLGASLGGESDGRARGDDQTDRERRRGGQGEGERRAESAPYSDRWSDPSLSRLPCPNPPEKPSLQDGIA